MTIRSLTSISFQRIVRSTRREIPSAKCVGISGKQHHHVYSRKKQNLRCLYGRLWITISGNANDIVLRSGESLGIPQGANVVISSLDDCSEFLLQNID